MLASRRRQSWVQNREAPAKTHKEPETGVNSPVKAEREPGVRGRAPWVSVVETGARSLPHVLQPWRSEAKSQFCPSCPKEDFGYLVIS